MAKVKVKQLLSAITRKRTGGDQSVLYKIMQVLDWQIPVAYKCIDVDSDSEIGNTTGGTYYITPEELQEIRDSGVEVKLIPPVRGGE